MQFSVQTKFHSPPLYLARRQKSQRQRYFETRTICMARYQHRDMRKCVNWPFKQKLVSLSKDKLVSWTWFPISAVTLTKKKLFHCLIVCLNVQYPTNTTLTCLNILSPPEEHCNHWTKVQLIGTSNYLYYILTNYYLLIKRPSFLEVKCDWLVASFSCISKALWKVTEGPPITELCDILFTE